MRDIALARLTGAPVHFQHLSTAGSVEHGARRPRPAASRSPPRPRPTTSRSPTPRAPAYDPVFKVNPPLRTDADVAAVQGRAGRRHHRRHRHRPRPAHAGGQGAAVRPGAARHARPRDGAGPRPHRARPADRAGAGAAVVAAGRHRRHRRPPRRPDRRGPARQPLRDRPRRDVDGRRTGGASRSRNTPYAGRTLPGRVRHTILAASPSSSTAGPALNGGIRRSGARSRGVRLTVKRVP